MAEYVKIPVDPETAKDVIALAEIMGLGKRGQGAVVRILVKEKLAKLALHPQKEDKQAPDTSTDEPAEDMPAVDDVA
jgi:hypothetical protein